MSLRAPLHIAFVITRGDAVGGATIHVRDLARHLLDRGDLASVLVGEVPAAAEGNGRKQEAMEEFRRYGIPCYPIPSLRRAIHPVHDLAAVHELTKVLRQLRPDLVSTHTSKAGLLGRLGARAAGLPAIYTPHGWTISDRISSTSGRIFRIAERMAAPLARKIVNVCEAEKRLAQSHQIAPAGKLAVIHNGVHEILAGFKADPTVDPPRLIMVARFEAPKNHELLLQALAPLRDFDWQLELVGSGPGEAAVRALAVELQLDQRIHFTGPTTNTAERLSKSQIFVLATKSEGFPRSILEAMRAGLPVVASDVGGISEAVLHRQTGFVIPRNDRESLTQTLATLIVRPDLRGQLGRAGRQRYERNFTFERMAERTVAMYEEISGMPARIPAPAGRS